MRTARVGLPGRVGLCRGTTGAALPRLPGQRVASAIATAIPVSETIPPALRM